MGSLGTTSGPSYKRTDKRRRGLTFCHMRGDTHPDPTGAWVELEGDYPLSEDFIGRWVESTKATQQRYSAFNDMVALYRDSGMFVDLPGKPKVMAFYDALTEDLDRYRMIVDTSQVKSLILRHKIDFIRQAGNFRYGANLLLALFRHFKYEGDEHEAITEFLTAYQRWILSALLTPGLMFSNSNVYRAIAEIKIGNVKKAQVAFSLSDDDTRRLEGYIRGDIVDHDIAKLLVATYVWHEHGQIGMDDVVKRQWEIDYPTATLEHILPRKPASGTNWLKDFSEEQRAQLTHKLGNMTLLTLANNGRAKNLDFERKKKVYSRTFLPITRDLAAQTGILPDYLSARHEQMVRGILQELGM